MILYLRHVSLLSNIIAKGIFHMSVTKNIKCNFHIVACAKSDSDFDNMLRNETEWLGDPTGPSGTVIAMQLKEWEVINKKATSKCNNINNHSIQDVNETIGCKSLTFTFKGTQFCVDLINEAVSCSKRPLTHETHGPSDMGWWDIVHEKQD